MAEARRMKVSFELSPKDVRYFQERLRRVRAQGESRDEQRVIREAGRLVRNARAAEPPEFVLQRIDQLDQLALMLVDEEWRLEGKDRARILDALAYFAEPDDLIPDRVPGVGYLDDAIMVELVVRELRHAIEAYQDFCEVRRNDPAARGAARREARRRALQGRMRRRVRRDREASTLASALRLW